jgi:small subunit ribosomal protein S19e
MVSIDEVDSSELIRKTADELRDKMKKPEWAKFVKTGVQKERPPEDENWWQMRSASVLRRLYVDGPVGIEKLRSYYGGLHRRGHKPAHFAKGSGKIIRVILQDLEKNGYVKKEKKGRVITPAGQKLLNSVAKKLAK